MKTLLFGIVVIIIVGFGGLAYRNAVEHTQQPIMCPLDARVCPDGTAVARTGSSCTFAPCAPPNVSLDTVDIAFAIPDGFVASTSADTTSVAFYTAPDSSSAESHSISIHQYSIRASSTALATIQETALGAPSGTNLPTTAFSSTMLGTHRFTVVLLERFEGVVTTAYYLARGTDVLRFDSVDTGVQDWANTSLDTTTLAANRALRKLLTTLEGTTSE